MMKKTFWLRSLILLTLLAPAAIVLRADDAKDGSNTPTTTDLTDNDYYWKQKQFNNLGRLGEPFDGFETAVQHKQNSKESEAYLSKIRQQIVNEAKRRGDERSTLNYNSNSPDSALNVTYLEKGHIKVTIQAKYLFDENTASLKTASMDVINHLASLLQSNEGSQIDLTMIDELDPAANAKDIDAERSLAVFSLLTFKKIAASQS